MEQIKKEEVSICLEILNEIAMNGVNLRQAELLVVLRNTLTQGPELEEKEKEKEKEDGVQ